MIQTKGIRWPFGFESGRVAVSVDESHIRQSVFQIVGTGKGEYVMRPDFGSDLHLRIFDPLNVSAIVGGDIESALRKWEQRVEFLDAKGDLQ